MSGHILRVTVDPYDPDACCGEVICSGVTDACRTWWECREYHWFDFSLYRYLFDSIDDGHDLLHGQQHRYIDGMVTVPSEQRIGNALDSASDSAWEAAEGREPGDYPCAVEYEGDEYVSVSVLAAEVTP